MSEDKGERVVTQKEIMGSLVAVRSVLERALNLLTREQLQFMHEVEAGTYVHCGVTGGLMTSPPAS